MTTAAQTRIDEEIAKEACISSIYNLRTQRNCLAPISRIPVEILANIFVHRARDNHYRTRLYSTLTVHSWVNVSHVCRHWRSVALDFPTPWTYISMTSRRWTEISLARSKQMPLKLRVSASAHQTSHVLRLVEQVMNHVERIQELHFDLPGKVAPRVFSILSSRAPRLQNLSICTKSGNSPEWSSALFDGDTPALHTLELLSCPLSWYSFTLRGLTTLSIKNVPVKFQQDTMEFIATLRCMQGLRHLYLNHALDYTPDPLFELTTVMSNPSQKVDLPHLSRLLVVAPIATLVQFLFCIIIPSTTEVRLYCESDERVPLEHYYLILFILGQTFSTQDNRALSNHKIRSLVINASEWEGAQITLSESERDCESVDLVSYPEWGCSIPLRITVDLPHTSENMIHNLCNTMPLMDIRSIHFIGAPFSPYFWWRMLGHRHLQGLQYIKLSTDRDNEEMADLTSLLAVAAEEDRYDRHIKLMPMLEEIELHYIAFPPEGETSLQSLFDALASRNDPQGRLTMVGCILAGSDSDGFDMVRLWDGTIVSGGYPGSVEGDLAEE